MTYSLEAVALACMLGRWVFELQNDRRPWLRAHQHRQLLGAFAGLQHLLGPQLDGPVECGPGPLGPAAPGFKRY
jgi:hypothetical protein